MARRPAIPSRFTFRDYGPLVSSRTASGYFFTGAVGFLSVASSASHALSRTACA
jgi:hypothetical protein